MTWASGAREGKAYSPAFSLRAARVAWAAAMNTAPERTTPWVSRSEAISGRLAPWRRITVVIGPRRPAGPGPKKDQTLQAISTARTRARVVMALLAITTSRRLRVSGCLRTSAR